ncbi:MAG: PEP-utilizing enzyme [Dehalococcoidia bacterium]
MYAFPPVFQCHHWLHSFLQRELGIDDEAQVAIMEQGVVNDMTSSQLALWKLAQQANSYPEVRQTIENQSPSDLLEVLPNIKGGGEFLQVLQNYLDKYGWRVEIWFELSTPTWQEDPVPALRVIQKYLSGEDPDPHLSHARAARLRRNVIRRLSARLRNQPEKLSEFKSLLATARQYLPVREGRAMWQLILSGSLRVPCLALGEKLSALGILPGADDIFYFRLEELERVASGSGNTNWGDVAEERRRERQHRMSTSPPVFIGRLPESSGDGRTGVSTNGSAKEQVPSEMAVLSGIAASPGVVQATAQVVLNWEEADKVQPGDILVCRTTSPAWTPLFARLSGVVADGGSVLSHCANVAREFGIPCVVGVRTGTSQIQDGMLIELDGSQGTVQVAG